MGPSRASGGSLPAPDLADIKSLRLVAAAGRLQRMLGALQGGERVHVRPGTGHLTIERQDGEGAWVVVARAVPVASQAYRLMVLGAPGRWDSRPGMRPLEEIADGILELLHPPAEGAEDARRHRQGRAPAGIDD